MSFQKLPKRFFSSPLIEFANFKNGSFVNLIKLKKPYANGTKYAVYQTTKSPLCFNGLFKTYDLAKKKFEQNIENCKYELTERGTINKNSKQ